MELTKHFEGKKWEIVYGRYDGMEKRSVDLLYAVLKRYVPYIPEVVTAPTDRAPRRREAPEGAVKPVLPTWDDAVGYVVAFNQSRRSMRGRAR